MTQRSVFSVSRLPVLMLDMTVNWPVLALNLPVSWHVWGWTCQQAFLPWWRIFLWADLSWVFHLPMSQPFLSLDLSVSCPVLVLDQPVSRFFLVCDLFVSFLDVGSVCEPTFPANGPVRQLPRPGILSLWAGLSKHWISLWVDLP